MMRLAAGVLVSLGLSSTLAAQQDTVVTHVSSDTVTVQPDSALADSVPITVTRIDTVGWDFIWQQVPGSRVVTDLWRFVVTTLLCVGCVPADPVAPPDTTPPPPVDTTTPPPVDSVPLPPVDTTPPAGEPPTGSAHPNEPAGYVRFAEYDFTVPINQGIGNSNGAELDGCIWKWDTGSHFSVVPDPAAPSSPTDVLDVLFPQGMASGTGVGMYQLWDGCSETNNTEYSKLYVSTWIKMVGADWEAHPVLTKFLGYWGVGFNGQGRPPTHIIGLIDQPRAGLFDSTFTFAVIQQDAVSRRLSQNRNTSLRIRTGVWHHVELIMELNTLGAADGILRWYLDGQLAMDYSNVVWRTPAAPSGFYGRRYGPIWGGAGTAPKSRDDHIYIDHEYMSGVR